MLGLRDMGWVFLCGSVVHGCAVDVGGIPNDDPADMFVRAEDSGPMETPDLGPGEEDLGPPPDMPDCEPVAELCNDTDDDCDGRVDEDIAVTACDGDEDGCMDGTSTCVDGDVVCEGDARANQVGGECDGPDADSVAEGTFACEGDVLVCPDDCVAEAEACNQRDDDCDGAVDEEGACSDDADTCRAVRRGEAVYLICTDPGGESNYGAEGECDRGEYDLAVIDDEDELTFLYGEAGVGNWWVGARTDRFDGPGRRNTDTWSWRPSGADVDEDLWADDEPSGDGSCAHLWDARNGQLNDASCTNGMNYICEGVVRP